MLLFFQDILIELSVLQNIIALYDSAYQNMFISKTQGWHIGKKKTKCIILKIHFIYLLKAKETKYSHSHRIALIIALLFGWIKPIISVHFFLQYFKT